MITPVLLCGGSGTRLWPLSRKSFPKQFADVVGNESLFQASAKRLSGEKFNKPVVVAAPDYRFIVTEQLEEAGISGGTVLIEPEGRNTAPAILAAAIRLAQEDDQQLILVAPSDHIIADVDAFHATLEMGKPAAEAGMLVTFGITPDRPETGYGYLELPNSDKISVQPLVRFVEKPNKELAESMLASGNYLWNAGIFLFKVSAIIEAFEKYAPNLIEPVKASTEATQSDLNFFRLSPESWGKVDNISIDYAVMEKADNLVVVPFDGGWSDLGGWDAVWEEMDKDTDGNARNNKETLIDCKNTLLRSESDDVELVGIGLEDTMVIATKDAVLVADKSRAQDIKLAVANLKEKGAPQAESFPRDNRPWGWFETLALADRFQVKRIVVKPGAALSLQSHVHRSEHWIVVSGTAKVTVDGETKLLTENQSVYIPVGAVHRMENPGKVPMVLIEVQTGSYLGEDDIERYEDIYDRS